MSKITRGLSCNTVRVDTKIENVVVHWDIAFGGFLYIGYWFFECPVHWILHFEEMSIYSLMGLRVGMSILQTLTDMWLPEYISIPFVARASFCRYFFDRIEGLGPRIVSWLTRDQPKTSFWTHSDRYRPGIFREAVSILKHRHHRWLRLQQWVQSIGHGSFSFQLVLDQVNPSHPHVPLQFS